MGIAPEGAPTGVESPLSTLAVTPIGTPLKTTLILNPAAAAGRAKRLLEPVRARLNEAGVEHNVVLSQAPGGITELCREAVESGTTRLIVAGGDGTFFEAINGIMSAARSDVVLAPVPVGTGNDFAKMLGSDLRWTSAVDRIATGATRRIDVGQLQTEHARHYFLNGVGVGFDAQMTAISQRLKHLPAPYYLALLKGWFAGVTPHAVTVGSADHAYKNTMTLCAISNGQYVGGAFHIAPDAAIDDGKLDVVIADHLSRLGLLRVLPALFASRHLERDAVTHWQAPTATLSATTPLPIHLDGELIKPAKNLKVTLLPKALSVVA